jgi:hypothetical protein
VIKKSVGTNDIRATEYSSTDVSVYDLDEHPMICGLCGGIDKAMSDGQLDLVHSLTVDGWNAVKMTDSFGTFATATLNSKGEYEYPNLSDLFQQLLIDDLKNSRWCKICGMIKFLDTFVKQNPTTLDCSFTLYETDKDIKKVTVGVPSSVVSVNLNGLSPILYIDAATSTSIQLKPIDSVTYKAELNGQLMATVNFNRIVDSNSVNIIEVNFDDSYSFDFVDNASFTIQVPMSNVSNIESLSDFDVVTATSWCYNLIDDVEQLKPHRIYKGCFKR